LHERSISHLVGRVKINVVWRKGAIQQQLARDFVEAVKDSMRRKRLAAESAGAVVAKSSPANGRQAALAGSSTS
jgi:hypothetical protein